MNQEKAKKSKRRKYDADYKAEVLKTLVSGQSATQIAKLLGVGENLIYRWKSEQKKSEPEPEVEELVVIRALEKGLQSRILKKGLILYSD